MSVFGSLGRNVTSLTFLKPSKDMRILVSPKPKPPCGGAPYLKKSR